MPDNAPPNIEGSTGYMAHLGVHRTACSDGFARFELDIGPQHLNLRGIPHGGVYASILDSALGSSGCWDSATETYFPSVTLNLNISYLSPLQGTHLICEARRVGGGKSIYFSEGEVRDDTGAVLARASGTFKLMSRRKAPTPET
ncbi:PaaI family thioesterase [Pararhodobacter sp.]|uniref:PaaI family thioesterase n=1 Tax=Pararhodobacter sp. TaxID=2127056 RepID=UPI002AFDE534|nr:PaaI family thioesterase [Pararhodobacter sp.]